MSEIVYLFIVLALIGAIIFINILNTKERARWQAERKDLYDRIMSGSVDEYRIIKEQSEKPRVVNNMRERQKQAREVMDELIGKERQEK